MKNRRPRQATDGTLSTEILRKKDRMDRTLPAPSYGIVKSAKDVSSFGLVSKKHCICNSLFPAAGLHT